MAGDWAQSWALRYEPMAKTQFLHALANLVGIDSADTLLSSSIHVLLYLLHGFYNTLQNFWNTGKIWPPNIQKKTYRDIQIDVNWAKERVEISVTLLWTLKMHFATISVVTVVNKGLFYCLLGICRYFDVPHIWKQSLHWTEVLMIRSVFLQFLFVIFFVSEVKPIHAYHQWNFGKIWPS